MMRHDYFSLAYSNLTSYINNTVTVWAWLILYQPCSFPGLHASFCYCTNSKWQKLSKKAWERDRNWVGRSGNQCCHSPQEVTEQDELILMYRFYYHMEMERYSTNINWTSSFSMVVICSVYKCRGSANVEMLYKQARYVIYVLTLIPRPLLGPFPLLQMTWEWYYVLPCLRVCTEQRNFNTAVILQSSSALQKPQLQGFNESLVAVILIAHLRWQ